MNDRWMPHLRGTKISRVLRVGQKSGRSFATAALRESAECVRLTLCRLLLVPVLLLASAASLAAQDVGLPLGDVPDAVQLEDLAGNTVDLAAIIGGRPALIEFWATWCPLCAELEPRIQAARQQHGDSLAIIIVAVGVNQSPRSIRRHIEKHPAAGMLLFDARGRAARAFMAPSTSYVVALNSAGAVVYTGVGEDQDIAAAAARALGR